MDTLKTFLSTAAILPVSFVVAFAPGFVYGALAVLLLGPATLWTTATMATVCILGWLIGLPLLITATVQRSGDEDAAPGGLAWFLLNILPFYAALELL